MNESKPAMSNAIKEEDNCCGIDLYKIKKASIMMRSLSHPLRKNIINALKQSDTTTVTDLYVKLGMEQSILSQHLAVLRRTGIVLQRRNGKFVFYSLNKDRIEKIGQMLHAFTGEIKE